MEVSTIVAITAIIFSAVFSVPQALKAVKSRFPKAISGLSAVFMAFNGLSWLLYGLYVRHEPLAMANGIITFFSFITLTVAFKKSGIHRSRVFLLTIALSGIMLLCYQVFGGKSFGYIGAILSSVMVMPQGLKIIRQKEADGVSGLTYLTLSVASLSWLVYGHFANDLLLIIPNLIVTPMAGAVFYNIVKYQTRKLRRRGRIVSLDMLL